MLRHWPQLVPNNDVNRHPRTLSNTTEPNQSNSNRSEGTADSVGGQLREDKECPFSGVTSSGRVRRKVPESDALSVCDRVVRPVLPMALKCCRIKPKILN